MGGLPIKPGTQEQTACPFASLHWLFGPQGDGLQELFLGGAKIMVTNFVQKLQYRSWGI